MRSIAVVLTAWFSLLLARGVGAEPSPSPDRSLTEKEYVDRGMPSMEEPWTCTNMETVAKVLAAIGKEHPEQLPRIRSKKSGKVFARLADTQSIDQLVKQAAEKDLREAAQRLGHLLGICDAYAIGLAKRAEGAEEFCELYGALVHSFVRVAPLADRRHPDVSAERRLKLQQRIGENVTKFFMNGVLLAVDNEFRLSDSLRVRLLNHLIRDFPTVASRVSIRDRAKILSKVNQGLADPDMKPLHPALADLAQQVADVPKK
jgi:hypothetical protein